MLRKRRISLTVFIPHKRSQTVIKCIVLIQFLRNFSNVGSASGGVSCCTHIWGEYVSWTSCRPGWLMNKIFFKTLLPAYLLRYHRCLCKSNPDKVHWKRYGNIQMADHIWTLKFVVTAQKKISNIFLLLNCKVRHEQLDISELELRRVEKNLMCFRFIVASFINIQTCYLKIQYCGKTWSDSQRGKFDSFPQI